MNQIAVIKRLAEHDRQSGRHVFTGGDMASICHEDQPRALAASLRRLVQGQVLQRAARNVYVFALSAHRGSGHTIEHIARALRRGHYNYLSLESALSEYGVISQVPVDRITVMTTGRKAEYRTPYGVIEFTHTKRSQREILGCIRDVGRPLKLASRRAAFRDLRRVGRNVHLVDESELEDEQEC